MYLLHYFMCLRLTAFSAFRRGTYWSVFWAQARVGTGGRRSRNTCPPACGSRCAFRKFAGLRNPSLAGAATPGDAFPPACNSRATLLEHSSQCVAVPLSRGRYLNSLARIGLQHASLIARCEHYRHRWRSVCPSLIMESWRAVTLRVLKTKPYVCKLKR